MNGVYLHLFVSSIEITLLIFSLLFAYVNITDIVHWVCVLKFYWIGLLCLMGVLQESLVLLMWCIMATDLHMLNHRLISGKKLIYHWGWCFVVLLCLQLFSHFILCFCLHSFMNVFYGLTIYVVDKVPCAFS
jgi:hypothetical protein